MAGIDLSEIVLQESNNIKVGIVTWNMGNASPDDTFNNLYENGGEDYDIVVFGFQEGTYPLKGTGDTGVADAAVIGKKRASIANAANCTADIEARIDAMLNNDEEDTFELVEHAERGQMHLVVYARTTVAPFISNIEYRQENTGFLHIFPNKGGILVTFEIYGTTLAFVSCHLTPHEGVQNCYMRNDSIKEILGGVRVRDTRFDASNQTHHIFWMGDMNYRPSFDGKVPPQSKTSAELTEEEQKERQKAFDAVAGKAGKNGTTDVLEGDEDDAITEGTAGEVSEKKKIWKENYHKLSKWIQDKDWAEILAKDELNREIVARRTLSGFTPLMPQFPPTFKRARGQAIENMEVGDDITTYYNEKRWPSYTDRILYKSMPNFERNVMNLDFSSFENVMTSDHKPVKADFIIIPTKGAHDIRVIAPTEKEMEKAGGHVNAKGVSKAGGGFELLITKMRGQNLAEMDTEMFGGGSDPYLVALTDPPNLIGTKDPTTSVIIHDLNPVWPEKEVFTIPIVSTDIQGLKRNAHLYLSCWDYDRTNDDDLIGLCSISFADIFEGLESGGVYKYRQELYENGEVTGTIMGEIRASLSLADFNKEYDDDVKYIPLQQVDMPEDTACCACAIM
jgi:hypothetical protein